MSTNKNRKMAGVMSVAAAALALAISSGATAQVTTTSTLPGSSTSSSVPASSSSTTTSSSVPASSTTPGSSTPGSSSTTTATTTVPATMLQPKSGTADITPGEGRVLAADGTVSPVKVADSLTADGQRVVRVENVSQSLKMDILVAKTTGDTSAPSYVTPSATGGVVVTMKAGGSVRVRVLGFKPLSNVDIFMASTPTKVATVALDATGSATTDIVVPSSLTNGTHTLQIQGTDGVTSSVQAIAYGITVSGGATAGTSTTVAGGTNLPSSGPSTTMLAIVAASLLGALGIWSRRRTA